MGRIRRSLSLAKMVSQAEKERRCIVGLTEADRRRLYRARSAGKLIQPLPRLYARADYWHSLSPEKQALHVMRGLQLLHPSWVFAGPSAAICYGLEVAYGNVWPTRIAASQGPSLLRESVLHQPVRGDAASQAQGLRVTSLARTAFDCMREMPFSRGLGIADSLLRKYGWPPEQLIESLKSMPAQCVGYRHALATACFADSRAENGGESAVRAQLIKLGYEVPQLQVEVENTVDGGVYRADMGWEMPDGTWLFGELDGHDKYVDPEMIGDLSTLDVLLNERLRESRVGMDGSRVMRFSFADAMDTPRFARLLDAYGVPRASHIPVVFDEERYCPGGLGGR